MPLVEFSSAGENQETETFAADSHVLRLAGDFCGLCWKEWAQRQPSRAAGCLLVSFKPFHWNSECSPSV